MSRATDIRIADNPVGNYWSDGVIDELAIFRYALNPGQIKDYYAMSRP
jgi:hypothetical protein